MAPWPAAPIIIIIALFNLLIYLGNENNVLRKKLRKGSGRGPMVISNLQSEVPRAARPISFWAWDLIDPADLHNGWGGAPLMTLYRFFCFVVFCVTVSVGQVLRGEDRKWLAFFTNWTYVLWGFLTIYGGSLSAQAWHRRRQQGRQLPMTGSATKLEAQDQQLKVWKSWRAVDKAQLLLFQMVASASLTLTVFYWVAVYKAGTEVIFDNPMKHGVSAFLLLVELFISRVPLVSYHLQAPIAYGSLYLVFMWIYQAATQEWLYAALDWTNPLSIGFYIALPILIILSSIVMYVVAGFRELAITHKCFLQCSCCCDACSCCQPEQDGSIVADIQLREGPKRTAAASAAPQSQFIRQ